MSQPIEGDGTPERDWLTWQALRALPRLELAGRHVLVVAPHPDDEVLGAGGLLVELAARGAEISVLALTDGEASHPRAAIDPRVLAARRADETRRALDALLGGCPVERLGLPDGGLERSESAVHEAIGGRLRPGTWCLAPLRQDGHPDHEAAGRAAARACADRAAVLVEYPVWVWHWSSPADGRVPWSRARSVPLSPGTRRRKAQAIRAFDSQIAPVEQGACGETILPPAVLRRFSRPSEVLFV
jgi:LmbE family N-acetylglucosaminyl deacetylase